jgi:hypothetical protein
VRYPLKDALGLDLVPHCALTALRSPVTLRRWYSNERRRLPCTIQETPERTEARALDAPSTRIAVHRSDRTYYVRQQKTSLQKNKLKSSDVIRCIVTPRTMRDKPLFLASMAAGSLLAPRPCFRVKRACEGMAPFFPKPPLTSDAQDTPPLLRPTPFVHERGLRRSHTGSPQGLHRKPLPHLQGCGKVCLCRPAPDYTLTTPPILPAPICARGPLHAREHNDDNPHHNAETTATRRYVKTMGMQ